MGIPLGHKLKMIKKIREMNEQNFKQAVIKNEMEIIQPKNTNMN